MSFKVPEVPKKVIPEKKLPEPEVPPAKGMCHYHRDQMKASFLILMNTYFVLFAFS